MYHTIEFFTDFVCDRETAPQQPLERVLIRRGSHLRVELRPYVVETNAGPVEVADLFFEDGGCTRMVPYACISFVES
jgi:hypothetical protein